MRMSRRYIEVRYVDSGTGPQWYEHCLVSLEEVFAPLPGILFKPKVPIQTDSTTHTGRTGFIAQRQLNWEVPRRLENFLQYCR